MIQDTLGAPEEPPSSLWGRAVGFYGSRQLLLKASLAPPPGPYHTFPREASLS